MIIAYGPSYSPQPQPSRHRTPYGARERGDQSLRGAVLNASVVNGRKHLPRSIVTVVASAARIIAGNDQERATPAFRTAVRSIAQRTDAKGLLASSHGSEQKRNQ